MDGSRGEVPAYFSNSNALGQLGNDPQILAREFVSGYVALFNTGIPDNGGESLPVPAEYQAGYEVVEVTPQVLLNPNGEFTGKVTGTLMPADPRIPPGRGFMLKKSD